MLDEIMAAIFETIGDKEHEKRRVELADYWQRYNDEQDEIEAHISAGLKEERERYQLESILNLSGGKKITGATLSEVLSDLSLQDSKAESLSCTASFRSTSVTVAFYSYRGGGLKIDFYGVGEDEKRFCMDKINSWIGEYRESLLVSGWQRLRYWFYAAFMIPTVLLMTLELVDGGGDRALIREDMRSILSQDEITDSDSRQLIVLMARLHARYDADTSDDGENASLRTLALVRLTLILLAFISMVSPKTEIEYGKSRWRIHFWRGWARLILFIIPGLIVLPAVIGLIT